MRILNFFQRTKQRVRNTVTFNDDDVKFIRGNGVEETVRWDDLHEVGILTTDQGPFMEDVYWVLIGSDSKSGCLVPQSADGCEQLLERLQQLPNFNNEAVIKAMTSTDNAYFMCWKKQAT